VVIYRRRGRARSGAHPEKNLTAMMAAMMSEPMLAAHDRYAPAVSSVHDQNFVSVPSVKIHDPLVTL